MEWYLADAVVFAFMRFLHRGLSVVQDVQPEETRLFDYRSSELIRRQASRGGIKSKEQEDLRDIKDVGGMTRYRPIIVTWDTVLVG